jgi:hypothetical protein
MINLKNKIKWESAGEGLVLLVLLLAVGVFGWLLWRWPVGLTERGSAESAVATEEERIEEEANGEVKAAAEIRSDAGRAAGAEQASESVVLVIEQAEAAGKYEVEIKGEVTVAEVLQRAQEQGMELEATDYGGSLGSFVEGINGVKNDQAKGLYWVFAINGQKPGVGVSTAKVKTGDEVKWTYEANDQ